ncbi:arginine--tRNA ligase [Salipaludibacillus keqinensis]|uniref:Arginine--tRNA ligase n=1 Tax=Salipaludibacillus keqinensis TaxID=2045207 RepID=A0A323T9F9_9BACI|nr:arginine--tRNA ligase [Salipaludibacillus keqinensis]PYZ91746.1 arginine--tRNA ligase [Salipaludibacillus keqinensis]
MRIKEEFAHVIKQQLEGQWDRRKIEWMIEKPKHEHMGDLAFPCFELAKAFRKSPKMIAEELSEKISASFIEKVEAIGGYVNVFLNREMITTEVMAEILAAQENYGKAIFGNGKVITVDFSSPNIAKPFSMGHLRSTVIGHSLSLIAEKCGYNPVKINHIGDWGTQFGKLITAYRLWGDEETVKKEPIKELLKLYVQFHEEAKENPDLEEQGRNWFKKLEEGHEEAISLWTWFRDESLKEFGKIYDKLGITFDSQAGEAFYNDKMKRVVELLEYKGVLVESEGAKVVPFEGMPPCLIKKRDGSTLYATRDLAAAMYRQKKYGFAKSLYVVGSEQSLHFKQLFAVLRKIGCEWEQGMAHVPFGMMLKDGKKMSTRKGKVVLLDEVLEEAVYQAMKNINDKNPHLEDKEEVARHVGTGAVIFHDLKHFRLHDVEFSLEDMLTFEGETGPYIQYTHARASSLLRKGRFNDSQQYTSAMEDSSAWPVVVSLMQFPDVIKRSFDAYDPSQVAKYVVELARAFNHYYGSVRILDDPEQIQSRLSLVHSVKIVLKEGLRLLGMEAPEKM